MTVRTPSTIISNIETLLEELKLALQIQVKDKKITASINSKKPAGLTGDIYDLINEGFFDQPKIISQIHEKLRYNGINKPITSLMKPLLYLIRKKILRRDKTEKGQFQYQRGEI